MCYGQQRLPSKDEPTTETGNGTAQARARSLAAETNSGEAMENLMGRLAETEVRLQRARAREEALSRRLEEMKRFVAVMEILETYLKRRYREQQQHVARLISLLPTK